MSTDLIRYDLLVQEALKTVVRKVLTDAARDGLPGDHHYYVTFDTGHAGVRISNRLREKYPKDITIILQHQFDGLTVTDAGFEVGLSFSGVSERLRVPFEAMTGFFDPSVQFGLKFEANEDQDAEPAEEAPPPISLPAPAVSASRKKSVGKSAAKKAEADTHSSTETDEPAAGADVVSLDSFRKKS